MGKSKATIAKEAAAAKKAAAAAKRKAKRDAAKAAGTTTDGKASVNKTTSQLSDDFGKLPAGAEDPKKRIRITPGDVHTPSVNAMKADFAKCKELCGLPADAPEGDVYNTLAGMLTYGKLTVEELPK